MVDTNKKAADVAPRLPVNYSSKLLMSNRRVATLNTQIQGMVTVKVTASEELVPASTRYVSPSQ